MARCDVVVIGAGLGGLTAGAILARAGRQVLVIERSNSVGGAASSYKSGDLFIEGSLQETSDPRHPRDPKHDALTRAGVLDAVKWIPAGSLYEARGGPLEAPFVMPDNFDAARQALSERFPQACSGIGRLLDEMAAIASAAGSLAQGGSEWINSPDWTLSLSQKLDAVFGDDEAVKCALAANLSYFHDDPATLWWIHFAMAQGSYLQGGGRFVQGGSQRLSSALARAIRAAGGEVLLRRVATGIALDAQGGAGAVTHTAKDGSDSRTVECDRVIGNAAPGALTPLMPQAAADRLQASYAKQAPSISLFAMTLGLARPPREFGVSAYSTQLLPRQLQRLSDFPQGARLMAGEPGERMPPMSLVDFTAIDSGIPSPPHGSRSTGPICCRTGTVRTWTPTGKSAGAGRTRSSATWTRSIPASPPPWWRRRSTPHCRSGSTSMRPMARPTDLRQRRRDRSGRPWTARRARRYRVYSWRRPMPVSAATPAWCRPAAPAPT